LSKGPFPSDQAWVDDKEHEIAVRLKKLDTETDPKERRRLERSIARYRELITLGPKGASLAAERAAATRGSRPSSWWRFETEAEAPRVQRRW
jgi:hypothetical protein